MRYALVATAIVLTLFGRGRSEEAPTLHVAPSMVKIRADQALPKEAVKVAESTRVQLIAARGECELTQIVASASQQPIRRFDVRPLPLVLRSKGQKEAGDSSSGKSPPSTQAGSTTKDRSSTTDGSTAQDGSPVQKGSTTKDGSPAQAGSTTRDGSPAQSGSKTKDGSPAQNGSTTKDGSPAQADSTTKDRSPTTDGSTTQDGSTAQDFPTETSAALIEPAIYRQAFLELTQPSNAEGFTGLWPDPLIPLRDSTVGESRRAFPVDVPAKHHQPVLVELCVPRDSPPGDYVGDIQVLHQGREWQRVTLHLSVRQPVIPPTSSIPVTFGLSGRSLLFGHYGERKEEHRLELVDRYARNALAHRISLHGMSFRPPTIRSRGSGTERGGDGKEGGIQVDFSAWDREIGPFLDGEVGLDGARFTAIDLRTPEGLDGPALASYYRQVEAHFREKGWLDRLFAYVMDEPAPEQHEELRQRLRALSVAPGIRRLVTTSLQKDLVGLVDIWTPNINCLFKKKTPNEYCHAFASRKTYLPQEQQGETLWWYQSCSSHGCNHGPFGDAALDRYFSGWPRYLVDASPAASRIMGWLAFSENVGGELYFDMVYAYNSWDRSSDERIDPWKSVQHFGGNGDGTLYYPGRPDVIGGSTHVPVESLRLKYIRDGLEDFELLRILASTGEEGERSARRIAQKLARSPFQFTSSATTWANAREELFSALDKSQTADPVSERTPAKQEPAIEPQ